MANKGEYIDFEETIKNTPKKDFTEEVKAEQFILLIDYKYDFLPLPNPAEKFEETRYTFNEQLWHSQLKHLNSRKPS